MPAPAVPPLAFDAGGGALAGFAALIAAFIVTPARRLAARAAAETAAKTGPAEAAPAPSAETEDAILAAVIFGHVWH